MVFRRFVMETPVILSAVRTPVGKFQGGLSSFTAPELGAKAIAEAARRAGIDAKEIDEAILGNVLQAGLGQNPARQAVQLGESEIVVAGGMKSMTNAPYLLPQARSGYRLGDGKLIDSMIHDGLWDSYENFQMGMTGEL